MLKLVMGKKLMLILYLSALVLLSGLSIYVLRKKPELISPLAPSSLRKVNYAPYSFENLREREYFESQIRLEEVLEEKPGFTSYLFSFAADGRRITGMANLPKKKGKLPVAILIRGWVDEEIYQTGMGSQKMADFLATNGFVTLAPDLLGYSGSDSAFADMLLTRFFRPVTIITLLNSLASLPQVDTEKVVFWSHSNGGQIALSVLEITGRNIPTSLWAPVAASFPESILYFAEEMEDGGEILRQVIGEFETDYDSTRYSISTYLNWIKTPLIIHQGTDDEAIPSSWATDLVSQLQSLDKEVAYFQYPRENHNFTRGSAPIIRERDLIFFKKHLLL